MENFSTKLDFCSEQSYKQNYKLEKKLPSIDVGPTALASPMILTLTLNPLQAIVMTYSYGKVPGQLSVTSEGRVETNGVWTGGRRRLHYLPR